MSEDDRELLVRLDERTEKLDRDLRQMFKGHIAHGQAMEARIKELSVALSDEVASLRALTSQNDKRSLKALEMAERHEKWFEWTVRIILGAVMMALLGLVLITGAP